MPTLHEEIDGPIRSFIDNPITEVSAEAWPASFSGTTWFVSLCSHPIILYFDAKRSRCSLDDVDGALVPTACSSMHCDI